MLAQLLLGSLLVVITCAVHATLTVFLIRRFRRLRVDQRLMQNAVGRSALVVAIVLLVFLTMVVEVTIWASIYLWVGALEGFEAALYFSMVTFTTLGYGDITLSEQWRLLASFQAAIGIILFGWTTALIVTFIQRAVALIYGSSPADR